MRKIKPGEIPEVDFIKLPDPPEHDPHDIWERGFLLFTFVIVLLYVSARLFAHG